MKTQKKDITAILEDGHTVDAALRQGVREALIFHKQVGAPIVVWRDNQVVWIPPEEIEVDPIPVQDPSNIKEH